MKKMVIFFFVFMAVTTSSCRNINDTRGQKQYKILGNHILQHAYSVKQTGDGGYIVAGDNGSFGSGFADICLIKTDNNGNQKWYKTFPGIGNNCAYSAQQTKDGGFIIAGEKYMGNPYKRYNSNSEYNTYDVYMMKTDNNGDCVWARVFGGKGSDAGRSAQQTEDNGYIIAGYTSSFGAGNDDVYIIKTDAKGDCVWTRTFGGKKNDRAYSVKQTTDGGYVLAGFTSSFGAGNKNMYIIKTDAKGDCVWTRTFGGKGTDAAGSVQQTTDGGYIIAGWSNSYDAGKYDIYIVKTDGTGNCVWARTFGGKEDDIGRSVQQTIDGGYIIAGNTKSFGAENKDIYIIKTDANGDCVWTRTFGGSRDDEAYSIQQTMDGGYIIAGSTNLNENEGNDYAYLIKLDANGNRQW